MRGSRSLLESPVLRVGSGFRLNPAGKCWLGGTAMNRQNSKVLALSIGMLAAIGHAAHVQGSQPSGSALQDMGLGGLTIMSDDEALAVRGLGFRSGGSSAQASGNSFATINSPFGSAHSENAYSASGNHEASGDNFSFAGAEIMTTVDKSGHGEKGGDFGGEPGKDVNRCGACNNPPPSSSCKSSPPCHGSCSNGGFSSHCDGNGGMGCKTTSSHSQPSLAASRTPRPTKS